MSEPKVTEIKVNNTGDKNDLLKQILAGILQSAGSETAALVEAAFQTEENQKQLQKMQDSLKPNPI